MMLHFYQRFMETYEKGDFLFFLEESGGAHGLGNLGENGSFFEDE